MMATTVWALCVYHQEERPCLGSNQFSSLSRSASGIMHHLTVVSRALPIDLYASCLQDSDPKVQSMHFPRAAPKQSG